MFQHDDAAAFRFAEDTHLLYPSSRPGYPYQEIDRRTCKRFLDGMKATGVSLAVVLLTLPEMGVWYGMNLCEYYERNGVEAFHYPIEDGSTPASITTFHGLMKTIRHRLIQGSVLMHCSAGIGRTGTVAAGLLIYGGEKPGAAIARIRRVRQGAVENRWQEEFLRRYFVAISRAGAAGMPREGRVRPDALDRPACGSVSSF